MQGIHLVLLGICVIVCKTIYWNILKKKTNKHVEISVVQTGNVCVVLVKPFFNPESLSMSELSIFGGIYSNKMRSVRKNS